MKKLEEDYQTNYRNASSNSLIINKQNKNFEK